MCFLSKGTPITRDMCFLGRGTHITTKETHITRDITRDMCYVWLPDPSPGAAPLSPMLPTFSYSPTTLTVFDNPAYYV